MSAEPLVLLPGMGCTSALWSRLSLPDDVLAPVLQEPSLDAEVTRLLDLLPARFALAGLSLGAIVAMALVRRAPERVSRLCLMSTNPYAPTPAQHEGWSAQRGALRTGSARELQASLLPVLLSQGRDDLVPLTLGMAVETGAETYDAQLRLQDTRVDERPGLAAVRCPTLVVAARDDQLCPVERHVEIARLVPGAELVVLENCAHLSPLEQPEHLSTHLERWLGRPSAPLSSASGARPKLLDVGRPPGTHLAAFSSVEVRPVSLPRRPGDARTWTPPIVQPLRPHPTS